MVALRECYTQHNQQNQQKGGRSQCGGHKKPFQYQSINSFLLLCFLPVKAWAPPNKSIKQEKKKEVIIVQFSSEKENYELQKGKSMMMTWSLWWFTWHTRAPTNHRVIFKRDRIGIRESSGIPKKDDVCWRVSIEFLICTKFRFIRIPYHIRQDSSILFQQSRQPWPWCQALTHSLSSSSRHFIIIITSLMICVKFLFCCWHFWAILGLTFSTHTK